MRADAVGRLERWFEKEGCRGPALDLGCGPGWLTARLARRFGRALGVDLVTSELERGSEAFADVERLEFAVADLFEDETPGGPFGVVVAASSAQYFHSLPELVGRMLDLVRDDGRVVVLDTPIYRPDDVPAARERTRRYFRDLGVPEAAPGYHHHTLESVQHLNPDVVFDPHRLLHRVARRLGRVRTPFPIVVFRPGADG
jgi:SAM-dependent methyltransferase